MPDKFESFRDSIDSPAREMFLITPHNTTELPTIPKAIRADSAGTVALRATGSGSDVTVNMIAGEILSVRAQFIRSTGTSATLHGFA